MFSLFESFVFILFFLLWLNTIIICITDKDFIKLCIRLKNTSERLINQIKDNNDHFLYLYYNRLPNDIKKMILLYLLRSGNSRQFFNICLLSKDNFSLFKQISISNEFIKEKGNTLDIAYKKNQELVDNSIQFFDTYLSNYVPFQAKLFSLNEIKKFYKGPVKDIFDHFTEDLFSIIQNSTPDDYINDNRYSYYKEIVILELFEKIFDMNYISNDYHNLESCNLRSTILKGTFKFMTPKETILHIEDIISVVALKGILRLSTNIMNNHFSHEYYIIKMQASIQKLFASNHKQLYIHYNINYFKKYIILVKGIKVYTSIYETFKTIDELEKTINNLSNLPRYYHKTLYKRARKNLEGFKEYKEQNDNSIDFFEEYNLKNSLKKLELIK